MNKQKFLHEMHRAQDMRKFCGDPMESEYWAGYMRGIRRAYHGERFGTIEQHKSWQSLIDRPDEQSKQRGRGYIDGLNCAKRRNIHHYIKLEKLEFIPVVANGKRLKKDLTIL